MRCAACGYEGKREMFTEVTASDDLGVGVCVIAKKRGEYPGKALYVCPSCGTVRAE
jgi:uncharacterized Zn finger protein